VKYVWRVGRRQSGDRSMALKKGKVGCLAIVLIQFLS
jgi:hypothetical protein